MNTPIGQQVYTRGSGSSSTTPFITLIWDRAPTSSDIGQQVTQRILDSSEDYEEWILTGFTASNGVVTANWKRFNELSVESLTGNSGGAVGVDADNNINTLGTGSITVVGDPATSTLTTQLTGLTNHSLLVGAGTATITKLGVATNGQLPIGSIAADPVLNTLTAGVGVTITNGPGSITISASGGGITWVTTSTNVANMAVGSGYFCISPGGALTLGLPATSILGDTIVVSLTGATSWQITQSAGQQIRLGALTTTLGAGGSLTSTAQGDSVTFICRVANTLWESFGVQGNITVV